MRGKSWIKTLFVGSDGAERKIQEPGLIIFDEAMNFSEAQMKVIQSSRDFKLYGGSRHLSIFSQIDDSKINVKSKE